MSIVSNLVANLNDFNVTDARLMIIDGGLIGRLLTMLQSVEVEEQGAAIWALANLADEMTAEHDEVAIPRLVELLESKGVKCENVVEPSKVCYLAAWALSSLASVDEESDTRRGTVGRIHAATQDKHAALLEGWLTEVEAEGDRVEIQYLLNTLNAKKRR